MKLDNVKSTNVSFNDYKKKLRKQGYRKLGSGLYAEVYGRKGSGHVIKVAHMGDHLWHHDGYLAYLRLIDPPNPMFPRIKSVERFNHVKSKRVCTRYYVVKMERLIEYENVNWDVCEQEFKHMGIDSFYDFEESNPVYAPKTKDKIVLSAYKTLQKL